MSFVEVSNKHLKNNKINIQVIEAKYVKKNEIKYFVDGKNVVLDYSKKEIEIANWLASTFGGKIYLLPRINIPENIRTADYLWNNEFWDLKEIKSSNIKTFDNRLNNSKGQSNNFILDISLNKLPNYKIINEINKICNNNCRLWIKNIIIIRNLKIVFIFKR